MKSLHSIGGQSAGVARSHSIFEPLEDRRLFAAGNLDLGFGDNGLAIGDSTREAKSMTVQSDGKIVVAGIAWAQARDIWGEPTGAEISDSRLWIARFNSNGTPDTTFSSDGEKIIGIRPEDPRVVLQSDGKIVVLGNATKLYRLNADASLDTTFDGNGRQTLGMRGRDVAIQSTGKIVVGGGYTSGTFDFVLQRFNLDGTLDTSFGDGGTSRMRLPTEMPDGWTNPDFKSQTRRIAIKENDAIVGGGIIFTGETNILLAQYDPNGHLDTSFETDGLTLIERYENGLRDIAIAPNGQIVVAGEDVSSTFTGLTHVVGQGHAEEAIPGRGANNSLAILDDGRIITAGKAEDDDWEVSDFFLSRHNPDGTLDSTFGIKGRALVNVGTVDPNDDAATPTNDLLRDVALMPNGDIVAVGLTNNKFVIARFDDDGPVSPTVSKLKSNGTLVVHGTDGNDQIDVRLTQGLMMVTVNGVSQLLDPDGITMVRAYGFGGNDLVRNLSDLDSYLSGGEGNDKVHAGGGNDTLKGQAGDDDLNGSLGNDRLYGDDGNDTLSGNGGNNYLHGGDGNDVLYASHNADILYGRAGDDRFVLNRNSIAQIFGGGGRDSVQGATDDDELTSIEELIA